MADSNLTCMDCSNPFIFTEKEQEFFNQMQFSVPKRCKNCRVKRKAEKNTRNY